MTRTNHHVSPVRRAEDDESTTHHRIAAIAEIQAGVVSRAQLVQVGLTRSSISDACAAGRLHRVHVGVYAVGHKALSFAGRCRAATLAAGPQAFVTGEAAAYLYGISRCQPAVIDIVTARRKLRLDGVRVRSARRMDPEEIRRHHGVPIASVARMLRDLADRWGPTRLAGAMHEAAYLELFRLDEVERCAVRHRTRRGHGHRTMRQALELHRTGSAGTQSWFERSVLDELLIAGVPMPRITPRIRLPDGRYFRPDLVWTDHKLVVEIDGKPHDLAQTKVKDRARTEQLEKLGYEVMRVHYRRRWADVRAVLVRFGCESQSSR